MLVQDDHVFIEDHKFLLCFALVCSFPEKHCFHLVSQELLDRCTVALSLLPAKAFFKARKKRGSEARAGRHWPRRGEEAAVEARGRLGSGGSWC